MSCDFITFLDLKDIITERFEQVWFDRIFCKSTNEEIYNVLVNFVIILDLSDVETQKCKAYIIELFKTKGVIYGENVI